MICNIYIYIFKHVYIYIYIYVFRVYESINHLPKMSRSGIVYKFECASCNVICYTKTKRHFKVKIWEQIGTSHIM